VQAAAKRVGISQNEDAMKEQTLQMKMRGPLQDDFCK
jgi:hypothetical protein